MSRHIGIDLGTANTLIYCKGKGIVLNEPSVVAVQTSNGAILAVGEQAKQLIGRTPETVAVVKPLLGGVVADFDGAYAMLKTFLEKAVPAGFHRPQVTVCVPCGVTEVEKRAVLEAVERAGGKNAYTIEEPMAAAMGAGLAVTEPGGCMVVDIGGGTCEAAVVSFGGTVSSVSVRCAGDHLDEDIVDYMKDTYDLVIGTRTAEEIKIAIGSVYPVSEKKEMSVMGRDGRNGLPASVSVTSEDVRRAIEPTVEKIINAVKKTLEQTPPELIADVFRNGIVLTGGGAGLPGLDQRISEQTGIAVSVAENPEECVAKGAGMALSSVLSSSLFGKYVKRPKKSGV